MIRKKENNKKNNSKGLTIVGSLFILFGICIVGGNYLYNYSLDKYEDFKVEEFYKEQEKIDSNIIEENQEEIPQEEMEQQTTNVNYVAVIKIPKINLEKGLCSKGSSCNNVNRNIQILNEADYPDAENGNFILAGHSGTGRYAYLKKANKLEIDDSISVIYGGYEYKYKIVNIYEIEKTGIANIVRNKDKNTLTLVTCKHNTDKQIIIISELVERSEYNG